MGLRESTFILSVKEYLADTVGDLPESASCALGERARVLADDSQWVLSESGWIAQSSGVVEWESVCEKPTTFPPSTHGHAQSDVTGLISALDGKEPANSNLQAHVTAAHAPANAQKNSDITKAEIEAKLTGVLTSHSHEGGSADPWTYAQVNGGSDFTTTSATAVDATGLAFTPVANTTYEFEALLLIRAATATVVPRVGLAWAAGGVDGVAMIEQAGATANAAHVNVVGNINAALLIAVGGLLNTTQSWPVKVHGMFRSGAAPSGNVRIQLASETAGTTVRIVARSFIKHRTLSF